MTDSWDWPLYLILFIVAGFLFFIGVKAEQASERQIPVTVYCEGEYRIFMRGEQIEVLYDPDCMKVAKA